MTAKAALRRSRANNLSIWLLSCITLIAVPGSKSVSAASTPAEVQTTSQRLDNTPESASGENALVHASAPSASQRSQFERFVVLPRHGALDVLDYLTLYQGDLYVGGASSGSVYKVALTAADGQAASVTELTGAPSVHGIAILPGKEVGFVTRSGENTVDIIDPRTLTLRRRIPVAPDPDLVLFDSPDNLLYVANGEAGMATLIDPSGAIVGTIPLGGKPEFAVYNPHDGLVYQNLEDAHSILALDLKRREVVGRWTLERCKSPTGLALDEVRQRLFAVCGGNATLVVFDILQHRIVASLAIGRLTDSVAYDASLQRIYSAGGLGTMTVVQQDDANTYRVLEQVSTRPGAHTLAVDSESHKIYVGYAGLFSAPRIAVFSARP
jgi:DNA-binding beta-propeller fold protein YncE